MKKILYILFISLLLFKNFSLANEKKIVFIDINQIFINSNAGKDLNTFLKQKKKDLDDQVNISVNEINNKKDKLATQKNVLDTIEYSKKIKDLEEEIKKINTSISKKNDELIKLQKNIEAKFSQNLNSIIEEYSIENSIDIIFKKQDILMAKNEMDITKDILNLFNKKINKINID
jgi:Skp family chaperone for outer membrane proteins